MLFAIDRDEEGRAKLTRPAPVGPTPEQLFRRRCYLLGITDQHQVDTLWAEQLSKRPVTTAKRGGRR